MGIVSNAAMSNLVTVDKDLLWPIPEKWSLEEGATVPIVYGTVYYALVCFIHRCKAFFVGFSIIQQNKSVKFQNIVISRW